MKNRSWRVFIECSIIVTQWRLYWTTMMATQNNRMLQSISRMRIWLFQSPNMTFKLCIPETDARCWHLSPGPSICVCVRVLFKDCQCNIRIIPVKIHSDNSWLCTGSASKQADPPYSHTCFIALFQTPIQAESTQEWARCHVSRIKVVGTRFLQRCIGSCGQLMFGCDLIIGLFQVLWTDCYIDHLW